MYHEADSFTSLYSGSASAFSLFQRKLTSSVQSKSVPTEAGSSTQVTPPRNQVSQMRKPMTAPAKIIHRHEEEYSDEEMSVPTQTYVNRYNRQQEYKNKENRNPPLQGTNPIVVEPKKRLYDRQEGAVRILWETQDDDQEYPAATQVAKRSIDEISGTHDQIVEEEAQEEGEAQEEDEEPSEDEGYEQDQREPPPAARLQAPKTSNRNLEVASQRSPKRVRITNPPGADSGRRERELAESELQASAQASEPDSADEYNGPPPSYQEINLVAKVATMRTSYQSSQTRTPWSLHDTDLLISLIGKWGCSWSLIDKQGKGSFERTCDQVGLKDKARNIKVDYLK
jgi:hypothetical protein